MCMGLGCNAVGVMGCRIIQSPRERFVAILTNSFIPCNGRFPTLIAILSMFFLCGMTGVLRSAGAALLMTLLLVLAVAMTLAASSLLSHTLLRGRASTFTLELPPFRKPQIGKVIADSVLRRSLLVLGRAVAVAAPAGFVIWLFANVSVGGATLLDHTASFLDPFARFMGLDGIILLAFILGSPANEIVLPIIIMGYLAQGSMTDLSDLGALKQLLTDNGWTWLTAVCTMLFSLMHWPCTTTLITMLRELKSKRWAAVGVLIPTLFGCEMCILTASVARLLKLV